MYGEKLTPLPTIQAIGADTPLAIKGGETVTVRTACFVKYPEFPTPKIFLVHERPGPKKRELTGLFEFRVNEWRLPGGRSEAGETRVLDVGRREWKEETAFPFSPFDRPDFEPKLGIVITRPITSSHRYFIFPYITTLEELEGLGVVFPTDFPSSEEVQRINLFSFENFPDGVSEDSCGATVRREHRSKIGILFHNRHFNQAMIAADFQEFVCTMTGVR